MPKEGEERLLEGVVSRGVVGKDRAAAVVDPVATPAEDHAKRSLVPMVPEAGPEIILGKPPVRLVGQEPAKQGAEIGHRQTRELPH